MNMTASLMSSDLRCKRAQSLNLSPVGAYKCSKSDEYDCKHDVRNLRRNRSQSFHLTRGMHMYKCIDVTNKTDEYDF